MGNFNIKFQLRYSVIVNFYVGKNSIVNFRNNAMGNDLALSINKWHHMEFDRKDDVITIKVDGKIVKTAKNDQTLFSIKVYNSNRSVQIKDFHITEEEFSQDLYSEDVASESIKNLENKVNELSEELREFKSLFPNSQKRYDVIIDSYNNLFNTLFLDYELKPRPFLKNIQELNNQILVFFDNVCKKHNLQWWLDFGNLLGAVRHENYVPWDDDLDVAMLRKDYNKFNDVIQHELEINNVENIKLSYRTVHINNVQSIGFLQILYVNKGIYLTNFDVFAYDYIDSKPKNIDDLFENARIKFNEDIVAGLTMDEVYKNYYENMNLSFEPQKYLMHGVDGSCGPHHLYKLKLFDSDKIFPLKQIKFGELDAWAPNDPDYYLKMIYGNYFWIPKNLRYKSRMERLRHVDNIAGIFEEAANKLKKVNENFE